MCYKNEGYRGGYLSRQDSPSSSLKFFDFHSVMKTEGLRVNFVMPEVLSLNGPYVFHNTTKNKKPYIYALSKLSRFDYEMTILNT